MPHFHRIITASAALCLAACNAETASQIEAKTETLTDVTQQSAEIVKAGADLSELPSGTYESEQGHAYVAFQYWHQGYSKPIIRWGTTNATVVFDNENPENSTLEVILPTKDIDTGVSSWDKKIKSADFFDVENYPEIKFVSTNIEQLTDGYGTLTGELTIKDVTKPFTLTGTINKVGNHFRSGVDMFGVSATGQLKRSEFGVDTYAPSADDIEIMVEVEFQKVE
ncbi:YceI family protein [Litorimonas sp. WD9-15]|uniref:YceI family protein n=1 Tax=Litorimonas sp. WD9-15 TaxID=3418716 RepID=UPI003D06B57E